jgi:metal-sulfur cluster biosynthetic enzyme
MTDPNPIPASKTEWQVDRSHPEQAKALREAWAEVLDPELGLSIVQLGLIREVVIAESAAEIRMILTTPFCPYGPALMENARQKAEKALSMPVTMELGSEAWQTTMMDEDAASDWGLLY